MSSKNVAVFGVYATPGTAEAAVDHLLANGFLRTPPYPFFSLTMRVLAPSLMKRQPKLLKAQPPESQPGV
jgi:hypothetical protein